MLAVDSEEQRRRIVYAEIVRLKREIDFKTGNLRRFPGFSKKTPLQSKSDRSGAVSVPQATQNDLFTPKDTTNSTAAAPNPTLNGYIIDHERRTLMTPRAWELAQKQQQKYREDAVFQRMQMREEREQKLWAQFKTRNANEASGCDRVRIDGDIFGVKSDGSRLLPLAGRKRQEGALVTWNGSSYITQKSGLLRRTTGEPEREHCRYFTRTGNCSKGANCFYVHDMGHIALCRQYLAGRCQNDLTGNCLLSHEPNECNTPICRYEFQDRCLNSEACRFSHKLPPFSRERNVEILTCRPFALGGWCDRGVLCQFAHLFNCPDYEEFGKCPRSKSCSLTHTMTRRIQRLISEPMEVDNVLIPEDEPNGSIVPHIISSYTVDPLLLFVRLELVGFSIDKLSNSALVIDLSSSEDEDDAEDTSNALFEAADEMETCSLSSRKLLN